MVQWLRGSYRTISEEVLGAFEAVPRHLFLPGVPPETAYQDEAIVIKRDADGQPVSSSSQPAIMALMLDQLGLQRGQRVLEIGAGTGYNAALISHLVSPGGEVVSMDIDEDVVAGARENLARAGHPDVTVVCADAVEGYPARAPHDRIIATVGVWDLAPAWLAQLAPGGRIVVPLDLAGTQRSVAFEAVGDGHLTSRSALPCGFMRLRGAFAGPERTRVLDADSGLAITLPLGGDLDPQALLAALGGPPVRRPTGVGIDPRQLLGGLGLSLAIGDPRWCVLFESTTASHGALLSAPLRIQDRRYTAGLHTRDSVAVFGHEEALGYGPAGEELAAALAEGVRAWDAAGRPGERALRIDAYPRSTSDRSSAGPAGGVILEKTHTRLALSWPDL